MTPTETAVPAAAANAAISYALTPATALAERVAAFLPARDGLPWTVVPYSAWWSWSPAALLTQRGRALVLVQIEGHTEVAWQLPGREPFEPDLHVGGPPETIAREILRLVLPVLDDEAAARARTRRTRPTTVARLETLNAIGHAMRQRGVVTYNHAVGLLENSSCLAWVAPSGVRYAVMMHGSNPVCDVTLTGPVRAVERAMPYFLPQPADSTPRYPLRRIRGRLPRRLAAHLVQFTAVDQLDDGGLAIGTAKGPYGYVAPAADRTAKVRDTTPASVELHGVGVDHLLALADHLTR